MKIKNKRLSISIREDVDKALQIIEQRTGQKQSEIITEALIEYANGRLDFFSRYDRLETESQIAEEIIKTFSDFLANVINKRPETISEAEEKFIVESYMTLKPEIKEYVATSSLKCIYESLARMQSEYFADKEHNGSNSDINYYADHIRKYRNFLDPQNKVLEKIAASTNPIFERAVMKNAYLLYPKGPILLNPQDAANSEIAYISAHLTLPGWDETGLKLPPNFIYFVSEEEKKIHTGTYPDTELEEKIRKLSCEIWPDFKAYLPYLFPCCTGEQRRKLEKDTRYKIDIQLFPIPKHNDYHSTLLYHLSDTEALKTFYPDRYLPKAYLEELNKIPEDIEFDAPYNIMIFERNPDIRTDSLYKKPIKDEYEKLKTEYPILLCKEEQKKSHSEYIKVMEEHQRKQAYYTSLIQNT